MQWTTSHSDRILALAEAGALDAAQLDTAAARAPLAPDPAAWVDAAERLFAFAGALLLAAGVIFFFAYNWDELHRFTRLGIAVAAVAGCVAVALFSQPFATAWRAALLGACLTTGALLALVGQTYQTGADIWELFVAWAALMLPFALLSRSSASWALWLVVANAGLLRGLSESAWFGLFGVLGEPRSLFAVAGWNLAVLIVFERGAARLLATPRRHVARLAALGTFAPLAGGAAIGWWSSNYLPLVVAFVLVAAAAVLVYLHLRRDVPMLAIAVFSAIGVLTSGLIRLLERALGFWGMNLVALGMITATGFAAVWLTRLYKEENAA